MELIYALFGRLHAAVAGLDRREGGQGTVEYVGIILLLAVVLAGVVKTAHGFSDDKSIAHTVITKLKAAIGNVKVGG
jgi:Flp pilus assembly protein TadG